MKQPLKLSLEIWQDLTATQQADLQKRYEVTFAKRAYSNGGM